MLLIAKRTAIGAALLLIMPVIVWLSGWQWQPGHAPAVLKMWYWMTETVTQPWGIITHVALFGWFLWCLRFRLREALVLFLILGAAILAGQGLKSWIKERVQEPRPFVIWLERTRFCLSVRPYHVCRQLGAAGGRTVVAAPALGHYRFAAGVGDGSHGQPPGVGHALAAGSYRGDQPFLAAGYRGDLAHAAFLRTVNPACRRGDGHQKTCNLTLFMLNFATPGRIS